MSEDEKKTLVACHCCGMIQHRPVLKPGERALCRRCKTPVAGGKPPENRLSAALSVSALLFYPPAMLLPMLKIEKLGHAHQDSLLSGVSTLFAEGYLLVGAIVLAFSVMLPPLKLAALLLLSGRFSRWPEARRALVFRAVEMLGRWGMLDVMIVAVLVAFVKLGDLVNITAGPGLLSFALLVLLSLFAGFTFNPYAMWKT
jgi:paraquat-inducible protein A